MADTKRTPPVSRTAVRLAVAAQRDPVSVPISSLSIERIVGIDAHGRPLVLLRGQDAPTVAETTVRVGPADVGRRVAVAFDGGDVARPIITGLILEPDTNRKDAIDVTLDGNKLTLSATQEIVLRCGAASLVLTADGTIRMRGENIASTASAKQRIRGATVKIN